jgi:hypothetical protein
MVLDWFEIAIGWAFVGLIVLLIVGGVVNLGMTCPL